MQIIQIRDLSVQKGTDHLSDVRSVVILYIHSDYFTGQGSICAEGTDHLSNVCRVVLPYIHSDYFADQGSICALKDADYLSDVWRVVCISMTPTCRARNGILHSRGGERG